MIILTETTDKIQIFLGDAATTSQLQCIASYRDSNASDFFTGRNAVNTNNTTTVDLVASPSSGYARGIDYISVLNVDTDSNVVVIRASLSTGDFILWRGILAAGDKLEYTDSLGFVVKSSLTAQTVRPNILDTVSNVYPPFQQNCISILNRDFLVTSNSQYQINQGLGFPVEANTMYYFEFTIRYETDDAATGTAHAITGPAFTFLMYNTTYSLAATTVTSNPNLIAYGGGAVNATTTNTPNARAFIRGTCIPTQDGYIFSMVSSETNVDNSVIVKAGSFVEWRSISQL
jgi:hypothetical protein